MMSDHTAAFRLTLVIPHCVLASYLAFNIDRVKEMLRCNVRMNISAGAFVRFRSFRAGMMQLVSKLIQQLSLALGHHCSLVVTQWQVVNGSILAKAGVSVKRKKDTLIPT
jgi:hypothetical protein